jgi:uncharacterized protein (DUF433 family)
MRAIIKTIRQWQDGHHEHGEGNVMAKDYVEQHDGAYWIAGTRVSLDSVVYAFLEGLSPESIADSFDTLTLEEVYGALAFYLGHRDEIDVYLKRSEAQFDELCRRARAANPLLYRKLDEARQRLTVRS